MDGPCELSKYLFLCEHELHTLQNTRQCRWANLADGRDNEKKLSHVPDQLMRGDLSYDWSLNLYFCSAVGNRPASQPHGPHRGEWAS